MSAITPTPTPTLTEAVSATQGELITTTTTNILTQYVGVDDHYDSMFPSYGPGILPGVALPVVLVVTLLIFPWMFTRYARETRRRERLYAEWLAGAQAAADQADMADKDGPDVVPPPYAGPSALGAAAAAAAVLATPSAARVTTVPVLIPTGSDHTYTMVPTTVADVIVRTSAIHDITMTAPYHYMVQYRNYRLFDEEMDAVMGTVFPLVAVAIVIAGWGWRRNIDRRMRAAGLVL